MRRSTPSAPECAPTCALTWRAAACSRYPPSTTWRPRSTPQPAPSHRLWPLPAPEPVRPIRRDPVLVPNTGSRRAGQRLLGPDLLLVVGDRLLEGHHEHRTVLTMSETRG